MFLKRITLQHEKAIDNNCYPFSIPAIKNMEQIDLESNVTFFVGENGSGKSTLLEAIADKCGFNTAGGGRNNYYDTDETDSALGDYIRLSWLPKVSNGFFLRAETFHQFASHVDAVESQHVYGGKSLHHQSHGESFLSLFTNRFHRGKAIYLLDEPEAALSPARQLAFLKILDDLSKSGDCQFIIASHSPILLGYPKANIWSFDDGKIEQVDYEKTDHYQLTSYFLQNREKMLKDILED